ncbi:MAG: addiction module antitoxin [Micropepsaceae bacterium]
MAKTLTLNVRVSGALGDHVATNVGEDGAYENVSEYVRDLIRRDKARADAEAFTRLKAELTKAFAAPDSATRRSTRTR